MRSPSLTIMRTIDQQLTLQKTAKKRTREVNIGVVKQQNLHFTTVIGVDNTSTGINEVLRGETATRSNTAIYAEKKNQPSILATQLVLLQARGSGFDRFTYKFPQAQQ